jgi:hypothetical protein
MRMCVEYFSDRTRPGARVDCVTSTTHVSCNWAIDPVGLYDMGKNTIFLATGTAAIHAIGKTNGAYLATPVACSTRECTGPNPVGAFGHVQVRFPDGYLIDPHYIEYSDF